MAQITIDIPDAQVDRVLQAFVARYLPADGSVVVPVTRAQQAAFAKAQVAAHIRRVVTDYERESQERAAMATVVVPPTVDVT